MHPFALSSFSLWYDVQRGWIRLPRGGFDAKPTSGKWPNHHRQGSAGRPRVFRTIEQVRELRRNYHRAYQAMRRRMFIDAGFTCKGKPRKQRF